MTPDKILFKFASRTRPEKFFSCIDNILAKLGDKENYLILVTADTDDNTMYNKYVVSRIKTYLDGGAKIKIVYGKSKSKVDAINRDMDLAGEFSILINTSDDMQFVVNGFDNIIREKFTSHYPDTDGCLHFNDGFQKDKLITMSILGKKYFARFNYIYHPLYVSLWCDNEQTEVAKKLNKYMYFDEVIFKHQHPANVGGMVDKLLIHTESFFGVDGQTYKKRQSNNFDN